MRFMVIVKASKDSEAGKMPTDKQLADMGRFNEEMVKAGMMLDGAGLKPSSKGARIVFKSGKTNVIDGPFAETEQLVAGYWIVQAKSLDEVKEWMKRCPELHDGGGELEIRPFYELEDFAPGAGLDVHKKLEAEMKKQK
jgi:hypothetical protein